MKVNVDWETFLTRFYAGDMIYVLENPDNFEFYTHDGYMLIHCIKEKAENSEDNIVFIERYMTDKKNLVKVLDFGEDKVEEEEIEAPEEDFVEVLEEEVESDI